MEALEQTPLPTDLPRALRSIYGNRTELAKVVGSERAIYTPPAPEHYLHLYGWDSATAAIIQIYYGDERGAETEVFSIFHRQREDGMVPNIQRVRGYRSYDPELLTFTQPEISSDYSQPPLWLMAIDKIYRYKKDRDQNQAKLFLQEILPKGNKSLKYFADNRQVSATNPLVFNTVPQETGRDFDESLNGYARKLPRKGAETPRYVDLINAPIGYMGRLALGARNRLNGWDPAKTRHYYAAIDPMFNSIYVQAMRIASELSLELDESKEAEYFTYKADAVEETIQTDLWIPDARKGKGAFLVKNVNGPVDVVSISSLGPLLLENLNEKQLESTVDLMDSSFDAPYPLPTIARDDQNYDPHGQQPDHVWVGEVMLIANWLEIIALRMQANRADLAHRPDLRRRCLDWADNKILPASKRLLDQGSYEGYGPETGLPKRTDKVWDFVWNGLIDTL